MKNSDVTKELAHEGEERASDSIEVIRDSTFARAVADRAIVLDLGRDVELGFLQTGPLITGIEDVERGERIQLDPKLTETFRLRLPWASAVDMAMHILHMGAANDTINADAVLKTMQEWAESSSDESGVKADED